MCPSLIWILAKKPIKMKTRLWGLCHYPGTGQAWANFRFKRSKLRIIGYTYSPSSHTTFSSSICTGSLSRRLRVPRASSRKLWCSFTSITFSQRRATSRWTKNAKSNRQRRSKVLRRRRNKGPGRSLQQHFSLSGKLRSSLRRRPRAKRSQLKPQRLPSLNGTSRSSTWVRHRIFSSK